jgi:hypothetical protein
MAHVDVLWGDEDGAPRVTPATLEDKSDGGVSVRMKDAICIGAHLTIKWGSEQASGTVMNCRREKRDYVLGVKRDAGESHDRT